MITKPTVGRKVWFYESTQHALEVAAGIAQPYDATIVHVTDDRCINVRVCDHVGKTNMGIGITLRQDGDEMPNGHHAGWMPYQVKQAEKHATEGTAVEIRLSPTMLIIEGSPRKDIENNEGDLVDNSGEQGSAAENTAEKSVDSPGDKL